MQMLWRGKMFSNVQMFKVMQLMFNEYIKNWLGDKGLSIVPPSGLALCYKVYCEEVATRSWSTTIKIKLTVIVFLFWEVMHNSVTWYLGVRSGVAMLLQLFFSHSKFFQFFVKKCTWKQHDADMCEWDQKKRW